MGIISANGAVDSPRYAATPTHDAGEIPVDAALAGLGLGAWAAAQRAAYAAGTLAAGNAALLDTIPGWTWKTNHDDRGGQRGHGPSPCDGAR